MPFKEIEQLEIKVKLVLKELRRLQRENKKYLLKVQEAQEQKEIFQAELEKALLQIELLTQLEGTNKKMQDEKTLLQSKVSDILNDLDTLEFL